MVYTTEEKETLIRYDELENCWYFDSNIKRHINRILRFESIFEYVNKELQENKIISVSTKLSDLENFSVNPFVKTKRKLSKIQKIELTNRFKSGYTKKYSKN